MPYYWSDTGELLSTDYDEIPQSYYAVTSTGDTIITNPTASLVVWTDETFNGALKNWYYRVRPVASSGFSETAGVRNAGLLAYEDNAAPDGASYRVRLSEGSTFGPVGTPATLSTT